ncbi:MAG: hypothetical protein ACUVQG_13325 [Thermogutta sp.]
MPYDNGAHCIIPTYTGAEAEEKGQRKVVFTNWVGHDGRSGLAIGTEGKKEILAGQGIGNNYWDLLPFGWLDCYVTI